MSDLAVGLLQRRRCIGRISREAGKRLLEEHESSGLTREAFCAGHGLSVAARYRYRRQVAASTPGAASSEGWLLAVEGMPGNSASKISAAWCVESANGLWIGVGSGFEAATLERLLVVLEQA